MLGCLEPCFVSSSLSTDFEVYPKEGSLTGVIYKYLYGRWCPRVAELDLGGELHLYKDFYDLKKYDLERLANVSLHAGEDNIQAKLDFDDGKRLRLKLLGPDRAEWTRRITQDRFPCCHPDQTLSYKPPANVLKSYDFVQHTLLELEKAEEDLARRVTPVPMPRSIYQPQTESTSSLSSCSSPMTVYPEDDSYVTKMARVFEPTFVNRRHTFRRT